MPDKKTQGPPRQQDRDRQPVRPLRDEVRRFVSASGEGAADHDSVPDDADLADDPGINTHGSDR